MEDLKEKVSLDTEQQELKKDKERVKEGEKVDKELEKLIKENKKNEEVVWPLCQVEDPSGIIILFIIIQICVFASGFTGFFKHFKSRDELVCHCF